MSLDGVNELPESISSGAAGHNDDHIVVHKALKEVKTELDGRLSEDGLNGTYAPRNLASFVTLGDSRTMYNGNVVEVDANLSGGAVNKDQRGYVTWAMILLRQRMTWLRNGGVGGDTVAMMLARTDALLALNPGWLIGMGVINSVNTEGATSATIISQLSQIFDKCAAKNVRIVWGTDWISSGTNTADKKKAMADVNEWLRRQVGSRPNFYLADYAAVMSDPATGIPPAALASDRLHQDGPGGLAMARELVKVLDPIVPPAALLTVTNEDTTNLLTNGMCVGNGGTGRATGWQWPGSGDVVYTKVARTDGFLGEWQQIAVTAETGSNFYQQVLLATGKWAVGDRVFFECEFETDAAGWAMDQFYASLTLGGLSGSGLLFVAYDAGPSGPSLGVARPESGVFRTPAITISEGATYVQAGIGAVGTGTFRVGRCRVAKV